jgi:uncharacterized cupin superfamily protein
VDGVTGFKGMSAKKIIKLSANPAGFGQQQDALESQMFASDMPAQHTHLYYEDDALGLYVGVWDTTDMVEVPGPYACDEFMWVLEGEVEIKNSKTSGMEAVQAGEAFVIPKGYDCQWYQKGYLRKFFVISEHPDEGVPQSPVVEGIVKFPASGIGGDNRVCYEDSTGRFAAGVLQHESLDSEMSASPYHQFVYVSEGAMSLSDEEGGLHAFKAGEAFFVPQGTVCSWHSTSGVTAFYTTVKSAEE